jgi:hypothetical protein
MALQELPSGDSYGDDVVSKQRPRCGTLGLPKILVVTLNITDDTEMRMR